MTRRLRSSRKVSLKLDVDVDDTASPEARLDQPVQFIASAATLANPLIIRNQSPLPGINGVDLQLLRTKQHRLRQSASLTAEATHALGRPAIQGLASTLIFAQHEAGTAVCIDARGWVLTCAHCFGETPHEWQAQRRKWLLYYTGLAVQVECRVWEARRDLALAKVVCIELPDEHRLRGPASPIFTFVPLGTSQSTSAPIICIGQPGADDLESDAPRKTAYDLIEISRGRLCGMIPNTDPQDNSEIGALKHNAWTYWGHSGAPLLLTVDGSLLGLHSSWDDTTAMRHGVPLVAIQAFLREHLPNDEVSLVESNAVNMEKEIIVIDSSD
ncbi:uncharacterized protein N7482_001639 [Penicillium canariense]|uniref:Uncharacterized protein n=1 Tax=Penicillium canariense TaxID=189055 RepID=A0A9W9IG25_9EURO|nr:uncharacterized protein N7482_001639 [Penicillium canariense]KAJ5175762.1 hypothetical protein N7482_001639 [Penicillium canariense]